MGQVSACDLLQAFSLRSALHFTHSPGRVAGALCRVVQPVTWPACGFSFLAFDAHAEQKGTRPAARRLWSTSFALRRDFRRKPRWGIPPSPVPNPGLLVGRLLDMAPGEAQEEGAQEEPQRAERAERGGTVPFSVSAQRGGSILPKKTSSAPLTCTVHRSRGLTCTVQALRFAGHVHAWPALLNRSPSRDTRSRKRDDSKTSSRQIERGDRERPA